MKMFFNGYEISRPIVAYIDVVGCEYSEKAVNIPQVKQIIRGLELLGKPVKKIVVDADYVDFDTKYYRRFPAEVINKLWNNMTARWSNGIEVTIKGNRFYTQIDGYEIVLPKEMLTDYDNNWLRVEFYV